MGEGFVGDGTILGAMGNIGKGEMLADTEEGFKMWVCLHT